MKSILSFRSCISGVEESLDNFQCFNFETFQRSKLSNHATAPYDLFLLTNYYGSEVRSFGKVSKVFHNSCHSIDLISINFAWWEQFGSIGACSTSRAV